MGDWAEGYFRELGKKPQADYGWAPVPGTVGTFQFLSDSFVLAVGAPDANAATAWLKIAGPQVGQEAFNPVSGRSAPAPTATRPSSVSTCSRLWPIGPAIPWSAR